mmetsp:Transcript_910/g.2759  ORF Transcript_910/g.2759 Transcript_910/m.2759 type:complete len:430 (-) Transcript_910:47-1336(-)
MWWTSSCNPSDRSFTLSTRWNENASTLAVTAKPVRTAWARAAAYLPCASSSASPSSSAFKESSSSNVSSRSTRGSSGSSSGLSGRLDRRDDVRRLLPPPGALSVSSADALSGDSSSDASLSPLATEPKLSVNAGRARPRCSAPTRVTPSIARPSIDTCSVVHKALISGTLQEMTDELDLGMMCASMSSDSDARGSCVASLPVPHTVAASLVKCTRLLKPAAREPAGGVVDDGLLLSTRGVLLPPFSLDAHPMVNPSKASESDGCPGTPRTVTHTLPSSTWISSSTRSAYTFPRPSFLDDVGASPACPSRSFLRNSSGMSGRPACSSCTDSLGPTTIDTWAMVSCTGWLFNLDQGTFAKISVAVASRMDQEGGRPRRRESSGACSLALARLIFPFHSCTSKTELSKSSTKIERYLARVFSIDGAISIRSD